MALAIPGNTTRRAFFGTSAKFGALAAVPAALLALPAVASKPPCSNMEFIRQVGGLATNGSLAAQRAINAGMRPEWLFTIIFSTGRNDDPYDWPALLFKTDSGGYRTFRPEGEGA